MRRVQWNVGQGGFHSATYRPAGQDQIRYVYDCGSLDGEALRAAVAEFRLDLDPNPRLDALVLSHIDEDHVNGVPELLLTPNLVVGYVLLPLLTTTERLFAISRTRPNTPSDVLSLIAAPETTLAELQPGARVLQVKRGSRPAPAGDGPDLDDNFNRSGASLVGPEAAVTRDHQGQPTQIEDSAGVRLEAPNESDWLLSFYVARHVQAKLEPFRLAASRVLDTSPEQTSNLSDAELLSFIRSRSTLQKLRATYGEAKVNTNASSLVMLSQPVDGGISEDVQLGDRTSHQQPPAWLHTGDASLLLRETARLRRHFPDHQRDAVGTLCLPHHGSARSFHPSLLSAFPNRQLALAMRGAHADRHRWDHPASSVMASVSAAPALAWIVSEAPNSRVTGTI